MSDYCTFCETVIEDDFDEFPCCDDQKIRRLEAENAELKQMQEHLKWKDEVRKENAELREEKKKLCESMLNVIGCVRLVSEDAYKCIKQDFIEKLKEQGE